MDKVKEEILCLSFNADKSFLAVGTNRGFRIFCLDPFELRQHRDFAAPITMIEMINRSNLLALVGFTEGSRNKLRIYDDKAEENVAESTFKSDIKALSIRQKKVCVALINKVFVLSFSALEVEYVFETCDNDDGLLSINNDPLNLIMAIPGKVAGEAILCNFGRNTETSIKAHRSTLSLLEISNNGHKLATVSEKGIKIRIYNTKNGEMIQELRRGNQFATVYSVTFDLMGLWLSVSSDSCNVHIFAMKLTEEEKQQKYEFSSGTVKERQNPKSKLYFMRNLIPYFDNDYSFATFKIPNFETDLFSKVAFPSMQNTLVVATSFGQVYYAQYDPTKSGDCKKVVEKNIF